jgi:tetratricopeptide (TPR) repeat protein
VISHHGEWLKSRQEAPEMIDRSLAAAERSGSHWSIAELLNARGYIAQTRGAWEKALELHQQSLARYQELDAPYEVADSLRSIGVCHAFLGKVAKSVSFFHQGLDIFRQTGNRIEAAENLVLLAKTALATGGDLDKADQLCREAYDIYEEAGTRRQLMELTATLGWMSVLKGDLEGGKCLAEITFDYVADYRDPYLKAFALAVAGVAGAIEEDYAVAGRQCEESLSILPNASFAPFAHLGRALAACGMGDFPAATKHNQALLGPASQLGNLAAMCWGLPPAAISAAELGQKTWALELLALAFTHPSSTTGWMAKWLLLSKLHTELRDELGDEIYHAAWGRGRSLDLPRTVTRLLKGGEQL